MEVSSIQKSEALHFIIRNTEGLEFVLQWFCGPDGVNSDPVRLDVNPLRISQFLKLTHRIVKESSILLKTIPEG